MVCGCKSGCTTNRCSCRHKGDACAPACTCVDCRNRAAPDAALAGAVATTREAAARQMRRMRYAYDEHGRLREVVVEAEDERSMALTMAVSGSGERLSEAIVGRLLQIPSVLQLTQAPNATLSRALTTSFMQQWLADLNAMNLKHLYTADAKLVVRTGDGRVVDEMNDVGEICRFFAAVNTIFAIELDAPQEERLDDEQFVMTVLGRAHLRVNRAVARPAALATVSAVLAFLLEVAEQFEQRPIQVWRRVQCLTIGRRNELLPIFAEEFVFG